jgi:RNA polymerase sigma-70 factor (ECF subfamily)
MDDDTFRALTDPYRRELQVHCYRLLGSHQDAEEVLQETLLAAWRGLDSYEERDSMRAWLYRIATNRCLNALRDRQRRPRAAPPVPPHFPAPTRAGEPLWLGPYPDSLLDGIAETAPGPEARYETREAVTLAFVAGLQRLPRQQRAVLVLRDVLGFRAAEVAEMLDTSEAAVNSALQRARATLEARRPADRERARLPRSGAEREIVADFADAVESGDVPRMVALLTDDAVLTMPPLPLEYEGREAIAAFLEASEQGRGVPLRVLASKANTQPALVAYLPDSDGAKLYGSMVLQLSDNAIANITFFPDASAFLQAGLPERM